MSDPSSSSSKWKLVLAELSAMVHMSSFHVARLFQQGAGITPRQFVIRRRIEAAKVSLATRAGPSAR
jgi:AraC family transcriptional regulator